MSIKIITDITNKDTFDKIINILIDKDTQGVNLGWARSIWSAYSADYFSRHESFAIYTSQETTAHFCTTDYYKIAYSHATYPVEFITADEYLNKEQVKFEFAGYSGIYEKSIVDQCWYGKIENADGDLVTYESSTLVGLEFEFIRAVNNYIDTLKEIEQQKDNKMKNLTVLRDGWIDPQTHGDRGWFVFNTDTSLYVYKDGSEWSTVIEAPENEVFYSSPDAAQAYITKQNGDSTPSIYTEDQIEEVRKLACLLIIELIVEAKFIRKETFSYHDVMKGLREIYGPGVELEYDNFKGRIINVVEDNAEEYNFEKNFNGTFIEWSAIEEDTVDQDADDLLKDLDEDEDDDVAIDVVIPTSSEKRRFTVPAASVRAAGLNPGDKAYVVAINKMIGYNSNYNDLMVQVDDVDGVILLEGIYTVDCYGNLHIGRKFFEEADLLDSFNKTDGVSITMV